MVGLGFGVSGVPREGYDFAAFGFWKGVCRVFHNKTLESKAWLWRGNESLGLLEPLAQSSFVRAAAQMNLGLFG